MRKPFWFLFIALGVLTTAFTGVVGNFPIGDDWQYAYPIKTWLEEGDMQFKGIFAPNILLQVAYGFLFCKIAGGFDFTWLRLSTLVSAFFAILFFYKIIKQANVKNKIACLYCIILFFNPLFYYLSFTFFTDIPFLFICFVSIFYFVKYVFENKQKYIFWAALWAAASFYIRQPGLLLIIAFAIFILFEKHFSRKSIQTGVALFFIALIAYFSMEYWVKPSLSISDNFVPVGGQFYTALIEQPFHTFFEWIKKGIKIFIYLGFFGLPFLPFLWKNIIASKLFQKKILAIVFLVNAALFLLLYYSEKTFPFGGNIMFNCGLGSELLADVYTLGLPNTPKAPEWFMLVLQAIAQLSATFIFLFIFKNFKELLFPQKKVFCFLVLLNAVYLPVMSITSFFDRYLLLTIASFFIALSLFGEKMNFRWFILKIIPAVFIALFSVLATTDSMAWNRAKNKAFLYLREKGVSIKKMDAGYEYNGFYNYHFPRTEKEGRSFWWVTDNEYMITFGAVDGYQTIETFPYYRYLFLKQDAIHVLRRNAHDPSSQSE